MRITGYDDYYDDYGSNLISSNPFESMSAGPSQTFGTVALILAIIISLVAYFGFVKSGKTYAQKFVNWLKEFLNFKRIFIENLLKFGYLFVAVYITIYSFGLIKLSFWAFLLILIVGNIIERLIFEFSLMMIMIWKNTSEVSSDLNKIVNKDKEEKTN